MPSETVDRPLCSRVPREECMFAGIAWMGLRASSKRSHGIGSRHEHAAETEEKMALCMLSVSYLRALRTGTWWSLGLSSSGLPAGGSWERCSILCGFHFRGSYALVDCSYVGQKMEGGS